MRLRGRLRRLKRAAEGEAVVIPQRDGTVKRAPAPDLKAAFLNLMGRMGAGKGAPPEHPLHTAARNSSGPKWSGSIFAADRDITGHIEDLSE